MKILAFETSCDDTAVAIVENGYQVLSSVRVSQIEHEAWGGVVPEIAARLHAEAWKAVLEEALSIANLKISNIDFLACTQGPGLQTSLLSGTTAASFLSLLYNIPLIPVHHIYGHLCSVFLERKPPEIKFPAIVLTASGGHTEFYLWENATTWQKLGGSLDDAVGEVFDKVAKMLSLGYPGGPIISKKAPHGDRKKYNFPIPNLGKESLDLSFSGVKSAVRRLVELETAKNQSVVVQTEKISTTSPLSDVFINDVCASFEETCGRIFLKKFTTLTTLYPAVKAFYFVGGVSANSYLKSVFSDFLQQCGIKLKSPVKTEYSTDNAAMIAGAAYWQITTDKSQAKVQYLEAVPRLKL